LPATVNAIAVATPAASPTSLRNSASMRSPQSVAARPGTARVTATEYRTGPVTC
jgi:hypothetical protein